MELMAALEACIAADEARANTMEHFTVHEEPYYSCAGSRTEPYGDLEWGEDACDCHLAERKARALREITFKRAMLQLAVDAYYEADHYVYHRILAAVAAVYMGEGNRLAVDPGAVSVDMGKL